MSNDFQALFNTLPKIEPSEGLSSAVLLRIHRYEQRIARIKFAFLSVSAVLSGIALVPVVSYALPRFAETGFYEYLSFLHSFGLAVLPYWKEFILTLVETIPVFEISLVLTVCYTLLESIKLAIKNMPTAFYKYN